ILLAPEGNRAGDQRLTSHSAGPMGARGLYETSRALGWAPIRRTAPMKGKLDSAAVYLVLDPSVEMGSHEVGALLAAVRRGAGLLFVAQDGDLLSDSLHLRHSEEGLPEDRSAMGYDGCTKAR